MPSCVSSDVAVTDSLARAAFVVGFAPVGFALVGFAPVGFAPVGFAPVGFEDMIVDMEAAGSAVKDKRQVHQMRKFSTIT